MKQFRKLGLLLVLTVAMMTACTTKNAETEKVKETNETTMKETNIKETNRETLKETVRESADHTDDGVIGEIGEDVINGVETIGEDIKEGINNTETGTRDTVR